MLTLKVLCSILILVASAFAKQGQVPTKPCLNICTADYRPYCGTDGITYPNKCALEAAICKNATLKEKHVGPCIQHVRCDKGCTREYRPQCGSDGRTYGNKCTFEVAACKNSNLKLLYSRECETHQGFCPQNQQGNCTENTCTEDKDCRRSEKCCRAKCGHACLKACNKERCPRCPAGQNAEFKTNQDGCLVCKCVKFCRLRLCRYCRYGNVKDQSGCPTCACKPAPLCKNVKCRRPCFRGYMKDRYGCRSCRCRTRPPCPRPRCPPGCQPWKRRSRLSFAGCTRCSCLG